MKRSTKEAECRKVNTPQNNSKARKKGEGSHRKQEYQRAPPDGDS